MSIQIKNSSVDFHYDNEEFYTLKFEVQIDKTSPIQSECFVYAKVFEDFLNNYAQYKKVYEERDTKNRIEKSLKDFAEKENEFFNRSNFYKEHNFELERQVNYDKSEIYSKVQRIINYNLNY